MEQVTYKSCRVPEFHVLEVQWVQVHVTLFSKYFASFPHGTSTLSYPGSIMVLDEGYHPVDAPIPGSTTRGGCARVATISVHDWNITIQQPSFQKMDTPGHQA